MSPDKPAPPLGRNDPCHCGSGKKYKKCCEAKDEAQRHATLEKQWAEAAKHMAKQEPEKPGASSGVLPKTPPPQKMKEARRNTFVAPKFNMPRRSGGG